MDSADIPRRSSLSLLVDWAVVAIVTVISLFSLRFNPDSHHFSPSDLSLSYPHRDTPKIPLWLCFALVVIGPIATIVAVILQTKGLSPRAKGERLNAGLLGLGISFGLSAVMLNIKNLAGKPRPDFLAVCQPDLSKVEQYTIGGFGTDVNVIVANAICQQSDHALISDAYRSFPSGYALFAFAGLCFTSMWLCRVFQLPLLAFDSPQELVPRHGHSGEGVEVLLRASDIEPMGPATPLRPGILAVYYLFLPILPIGSAVFIAGTRYFDFRNHGVDVIAGAVGGTFSAYVGMKWVVRSTMISRA